jgi:hypothetical protein
VLMLVPPLIGGGSVRGPDSDTGRSSDFLALRRC